MATTRSRRPSPATMLRRGILRRCPRCGSGRLFRRYWAMVADCPGCGHHFEREEGFFLGAIVMNVALCELGLMLLIAIAFGVTLPHPPTVKLAVFAGVFSAVVPILAYPFTKTTWTAVDMIMRRSFGEQFGSRDGSQPRSHGGVSQRG